MKHLPLKFGLLISFALILGSAAINTSLPVANPNSNRSSDSRVLADVTCSTPTNAFTVINTEPSRLEIVFNAETITGISRVDIVFSADGSGSGGEKVIGRAIKDPANPKLWRMIWDTKYFEPITTAFVGRVRATIIFTDFSTCNTTYSQQFSVPANNAPTTPEIEAIINPPQWESLVNTNTTINANFINIPPDLHPYIITKWQPQIGYVASQHKRSTTYFSGPTTGTGTLRLFAIYAGQYFQRDASIAVYSSSSEESSSNNNDTSSSDSSSTGSTTNNTTTNTASEESDGNPLPEIEDDAKLDDIISVLVPKTSEPSQLKQPSRALALILQSNEKIKTCMTNQIGDDQLSTLLRENRRPRAGEFNSIVSCFSVQRNVIPSIVAPVAPEDVRSQPETSKVAFRSITNAKKRDAENEIEKTILVLNGTATKSTTVLLYVFSEPLVLATTADSEGNWSYTLEDPIDPGEHEVYAMVDRGDGVYERSSLSSFVIGTVEATEENPNGLSLELLSEPTITASNRSTNLFIATTVAIVGVGSAVIAGYVAFILKKRRTSFAQTSSTSAPYNEDSQTYKTFIDGQ